jgi:hypothetical protein
MRRLQDASRRLTGIMFGPSVVARGANTAPARNDQTPRLPEVALDVAERDVVSVRRERESLWRSRRGTSLAHEPDPRSKRR